MMDKRPTRRDKDVKMIRLRHAAIDDHGDPIKALSMPSNVSWLQHAVRVQHVEMAVLLEHIAALESDLRFAQATSIQRAAANEKVMQEDLSHNQKD